MILLVAASLAACSPSDLGGMGGVEVRSRAARDGLNVSPTLGARVGFDLVDCVDLPIRAEAHLLLSPGNSEESGAVSLRTTTLGLPLMLGTAFPIAGDGPFLLVALVGPEIRYESVSTRVFDSGQRDSFWGMAGLAHAGV
ncbi:MAG: hypothetical protein AAF658_21465, partial [Myxococcota bacterium]